MQRQVEVRVAGENGAHAGLVVDEALEAECSAEKIISQLFWPTLENLQKLYRHDQLSELSYHYATRLLRALVDQKTCVALKVEFIEPGGVRKVLTVAPGDLKQSGPHWYASKAEMSDLKNGTHTRIVVTGVNSGDKLAGRYFSPQSFHLGN